MQEQKLALPTVCKKCGELFDMSYDLLKKGEEDILKSAFSKKNKGVQELCWECRYF